MEQDQSKNSNPKKVALNMVLLYLGFFLLVSTIWLFKSNVVFGAIIFISGLVLMITAVVKNSKLSKRVEKYDPAAFKKLISIKSKIFIIVGPALIGIWLWLFIVHGERVNIIDYFYLGLGIYMLIHGIKALKNN